jgi:hypothetical protein
MRTRLWVNRLGRARSSGRPDLAKTTHEMFLINNIAFLFLGGHSNLIFFLINMAISGR